MEQKAFQDYYADGVAHCYGCGRLNVQGLQIKSFWEGNEAVCRFTPRPYHTGIPGFAYGGLIASLIDCHATGTAAATAYRDEGRAMDTSPRLRYVTASLHVDFLRRTPIAASLELRASVREKKRRKVVVAVTLSDGVEVCAKGEVVAVPMPDKWVDGTP